MRIGIDFDNTIVNTSVTSKRYLDKHLPGNNLNSYHDLSKNEGLDFFNQYYKDITNSLDLFDGVYEAFSFFKENNITNVIFITPINHGGKTPNKTPKAPLQQFRNIITIKALESDFSVIQGNEIPFPDESGTDYFINLMYGDKLHPTELGYKVYAKGLATILC